MEKNSMNVVNKLLLGVSMILLAGIFCRSEDTESSTIFPAIIAFGDSAVDVGNNDYIPTHFKANYPPYGRDFVTHKPTGRFTNGKLVTDITADIMGFTSYPAPYLSPQASGNNLLIGANFGSAAAGYDDRTSILKHAISLPQQVEYYKEYQGKLAKVAGAVKAKSILQGALYIVAFGTSDFTQNYYVNPVLSKIYTPDQYSSYLVSKFTAFIKRLHGLGARRIGVVSIPPFGCLPAVKSQLGYKGKSGCISDINSHAQVFNKKLTSATTRLSKQLSGLKIVVFDVYTPFLDLVQFPSKSGFTEAERGCCGTGTEKTTSTSFMCNQKSIGTCNNATRYVFWDGVHLSEAANHVVAEAILLEGIGLIS